MAIWVVCTFLTMVNNATLNIHVQTFVWTCVSFFLDIALAVELESHIEMCQISFVSGS